jgi:energy-coupling factor transporter ATP-binding protein EcfA2
MRNQLKSVRVTCFKGIKDAAFDVTAINVFIGANNSGKSTLAQVIHFSIGLLQSIELAKRWGNKETITLSLSPTQLLYSPCANLYALGQGGQLLETPDSAIGVSFVLDDGKKINLIIGKGRNGNIHVTVDNVTAAKSLANLEKPFTIYSPGLAGIARNEEFISTGVLLRTMARGDANLVFRNILLRLSDSDHAEAWSDFLDDLRKLFTDIKITVSYNDRTDEHIMVLTDAGSGDVPIELAGTGVLQAIQILAYIHYFHPSVIILDEPDSHLHPNNQRLLCKLLQGVAEERDTQVFLTTHSRHVVDALSGQASFLWVRNGTVEKMEQDHDLAVLLDIGALDVKEMLSKSQAKCIVLTEDALKQGLEVLLDSSGVPMSDTLVLAYYGCTAPHNLRPLLELIHVSNPKAMIVVHRDRDYLTETEVENWAIEIRRMGAEPFLTKGVDIESHFLCAKHLAGLNNRSEEEMQELLDKATTSTQETSVEKYVNGRSDLEKKAGTFAKLNIGQLAASAPTTVNAKLERYRHAKTVLKRLRQDYQTKYACNLKVMEKSEHLAAEDLVTLAHKLHQNA